MVNIDRNEVSASSLLSSLQSKSKKDSMVHAVLTELNFNVTDVNLDEGLKNPSFENGGLSDQLIDFFCKKWWHKNPRQQLR